MKSLDKDSRFYSRLLLHLLSVNRCKERCGGYCFVIDGDIMAEEPVTSFVITMNWCFWRITPTSHLLKRIANLQSYSVYLNKKSIWQIWQRKYQLYTHTNKQRRNALHLLWDARKEGIILWNIWQKCHLWILFIHNKWHCCCIHPDE